MRLWKKKKMNRPVRLDRWVDAPGDNWPAFDLDFLQTAKRESLLFARLFGNKPRWKNLRKK